MNAKPDLPSAAFRREREASWKELDRLLTKIDAGGLKSLTERELSELPQHYRTTLSSLSLARAISLDRNLAEYLETLATRGYFAVYGPARRFSTVLASFIRRDLPAAAREFRWHVAMAALFLAIGTAVGWVSVARDPETFFSFVPEGLAAGRDPTATTASLRDTLYAGGEHGGGAFATMLFTHNASCGLLCFAIGFAAGVPVFLLLVQNGVILGAFAALFASRGLGREFFAWVLPHGVTELLAIVLCAAGGLVLAERLVLPGRRSRLENLAEGGRKAGVLATGAVAMLILAAFIEGIFRQAVQDERVRWSVVVITASFWLWYFPFAGRDRAEAER